MGYNQPPHTRQIYLIILEIRAFYYIQYYNARGIQPYVNGFRGRWKGLGSK